MLAADNEITSRPPPPMGSRILKYWWSSNGYDFLFVCLDLGSDAIYGAHFTGDNCPYVDYLLFGYPQSNAVPVCPDPLALNAVGHCVECPTGFELGSSICHSPSDLGEQDAPKSCPNGPSPTAGNPINFTNGNKYQHEVDFTFAGGFSSLGLSRSYNSQDSAVGVFGRGWSSDSLSRLESLNLYSVPNADVSATPSKVLKVVRSGSGRRYEFESVGGAWVVSGNVVASLAQSGSGVDATFVFKDESGATSTFNANGQIVSTVSEQGLTESYTYNANNQVESVSDDFANSIAFSYVNNLVHTATVPNYGTFTYGYTSSGSDSLLTSVSFLSVQSGTSALVKTYVYDDPNFDYLLTGIIDETGARYATWTYDAVGRGISSEHGANGEEKVTISYDSDTQSTVTNAMGKDKVYTFADFNGVKQITKIDDQQSANCPLAKQSFTYNTQGFLETAMNAKDVVTQYTRDARGLLTLKQKGLLWSDANGDGKLTVNELSASASTQNNETLWHASFHQPTYQKVSGIDAEGNWRDYSSTDTLLDTYGRVKERTITDLSPYTVPYVTAGRTRKTQYLYEYYPSSAKVKTLTINGPRLPSEIDGGNDDITVLFYNEQGLLTQQQNALGQSVTYADFNALGQAQTITDANNVVTTISYDGLGFVDTVSIAAEQGAAVTDYDYLPNGVLHKVTLPDQSSLTFTYNAARYLTDIENQLGEHIELTPQILSGDWQTRTIKTADGTVWQTAERVYDELGRVMTLLGNNGQQTTLRYDANDQLEQVDELGHDQYGTLETHHVYDTLGRLAQTTDAKASVTGYKYDGQSQLTSVTNANQHTTQYVIDGFGDTIQEVSPDRGTTNYWYDAAGNLTQKMDANSHTLNMTYDALSRITTQSDDDGKITHRYYDVPGSGQYSIGHLSTVTQTSGEGHVETQFTYNRLGLVAERVQVVDTPDSPITTSTTIYKYNLAGSLVAMIYPSGRIVKYNLQQGLLESITTQKTVSDPEQTLLNTVSHAPFGVVDGYTFGNGLMLNKSFDLDGRLDTLILSNGSNAAINLDYAYDAFNNIKTIDDFSAPTKDQSFEYDQVHQLTKAQGLYGEFIFDYDSVGNRLSRTQYLDGHTTLQDNEYKPNNNQIDSSTVTIDGAQDSYRYFYYDLAGNLKQSYNGIKFTDYYYNASNRMVHVATNLLLDKQYLYDTFGQKVHSLDPNTNIEEMYIYNEAGQVIAILDGQAQTLREYIYLGGEKVATVFNGNTAPADSFIPLSNTSNHEQDFPSIGSITVSSDSNSITLQGNRWRITNESFDITANTYLEFDFSSDGQGEIQGIGVSPDTSLDATQVFNLVGSQNYGTRFGTYAGGTQHYSIPVGELVSGTGLRLVVINDKDTSPSTSTTTISNVQLCDGPCSTATTVPDPVTNSVLALGNNNAYANQDSANGSVVLGANNTAITLSGNRWRYITTPVAVTSNTYINFDFKGDGLAEIQGIGLDESPTSVSENRIFKLIGSQTYGIRSYHYTGAGSTQNISIPVGQHFTGAAMYVVIVNDNDTAPNASEVTISNIRVCEGPCPAPTAPSGGGTGINTTDTNQVLYIHNDHLGTPKMITDESQSVVWAADYTPFGELINGDENLESSRFPGQYFDVATGLYYNYFRDYDPSLGRYIESDPIGLGGGINTYAYVGENPVNAIDPYGLESVIPNPVEFVLGIGIGLLADQLREPLSNAMGAVVDKVNEMCNDNDQPVPSFSEEEFEDCYDLLNLCNNALKETNRDAANTGLLNQCIKISSPECAIELGID